mmetsp:Transcript_33850/g.79761  ORF Transcript_33850/g.79761 Transcript_33850/m.79761 type:complete len:132 (+) Transcript_33850:257-652(+)
MPIANAQAHKHPLTINGASMDWFLILSPAITVLTLAEPIAMELLSAETVIGRSTKVLATLIMASNGKQNNDHLLRKMKDIICFIPPHNCCDFTIFPTEPHSTIRIASQRQDGRSCRRAIVFLHNHFFPALQ